MKPDSTFSLFGNITVASKEDLIQLGLSDPKFNEAKANLLVPDSFDSNRNIDLLPVVFNVAVVNQFNENGDGMITDVAIDALEYFKNKPINIEHKKDQIVGHIINASLSESEPEFEEKDIESFRGKTTPFYITVAGVIYSHIYPKLAQAIKDASDPNKSEYQSISTSWEMGFSSFDIIAGSPKDMHKGSLLQGETAKEEEENLLCNGGKGYNKFGQSVRRSIKAPAFPLGAGLTLNPAAEVKGVFTEKTFAALYSEPLFKDAANKNISQLNKKHVKGEKSTYMNEEQFKKFLETIQTTVASTVTKPDDSKPLATQVIDALKAEGQEWKSEVEKEGEARKKVEADLATSQAELDSLKDKAQATETELTALKQSMAEQVRVKLYEDRLADVQSKYELDEKELNIVSAEINDLSDSDEDFESYMNDKLGIIFAHKNKEVIAKQTAEEKAKLESKASKDKKDDDELETKASADQKVPNNNKDQADEKSLFDRVKEDFQVDISV